MKKLIPSMYKLLTYLLLSFPLFTKAQFRINIKINNPTDSIIYLRGMTFNDKLFLPKDTITAFKGSHTFVQKTSIFGGIYYLFFPKQKKKVFLVIDNKDSITITLSGSDPLGTVQTKDTENNIFFQYQRISDSLLIIDSLFESEKSRGKKFNLSQQEAFFKQKRDTLMAFRQNAIPKLAEKGILSLHFKTLNQIDSYLPQRTRPDLRDSFIQKFDINDPRLLFSDNLEKIFYEYLSSFPMKADSLQKGIDTIMGKINCNSKSRPYAIDYFISIIRNRNIQDNTQGLVNLIEKHVLKSKCNFTDSLKLNQYRTLYESNKKLTEQIQAVDMSLKDTLGTEISLSDFASKYDYTMIIFYSPTCEHCHVEVPAMDSVLNLLEKQFKINIGRYAICNEPEVQDSTWKRFITKHQLLTHYAHIQMPSNHTAREQYDAYSNPTFYLIDNTQKFLARKTGPSAVKSYLNQLEKEK